MNTKLLRLATSGFLTLGTALSLVVLDAVTPIKLLDLTQLGQPSSIALAQETEDSINVRVYQLASPAVVSIDTGRGTGSGSIISPDGLILTNSHVVGNADRVTVILADGREFAGEVFAYGEPGLDLAAVRIQGQTNLPAIRLARPGSVQVGQRAFAIGNPFGRFQGTLTTGIVSRLDRERGLVQTDAAINPGNSGGPLLNSQGELIGVNTAIFAPRGSSGNIGIGFAINVDQVQSFLTAVREGRAATTAQQLPIPGITRPPQPIAVNGAPIQGRLDRSSNVLQEDNSYFNAYRFDGRSGQRVVIEMTSNELDAYLIVFAPDGSNLAQDDDGAGGTNSRITLTLPETGTYIILANSYAGGETGAYDLRVATSGAPSSATSGAAPNTTPRTATGAPVPNIPGQRGLLFREEGVLGPDANVLQDGSLYREHIFQGNAGQRVAIRMESDDFDTYLILMGPDGQKIGENDDVCQDSRSAYCLNSEIVVTLPTTGNYRIVANAYDRAGRGRYTITVR